MSKDAYVDDVLAALQTFNRNYLFSHYVDNVTLAIVSMDKRALAIHGYSKNVYEQRVPYKRLYSLCERFEETLPKEEFDVETVFCKVDQPEKGVGRMFLPVGPIYRGDRLVATVDDKGTLFFESADRADALAVLGGILARRRDEYIDNALAALAREIKTIS